MPKKKAEKKTAAKETPKKLSKEQLKKVHGGRIRKPAVVKAETISGGLCCG